VDIQINGKRVTLRDKIEARRGWNTIVAKADVYSKGLSGLAFEDVAALGVVAISSWEFDGDPGNIESYASLDLVLEFMPLTNELGKWLGERFAPRPNS
jgi:hypothetical protein